MTILARKLKNHVAKEAEARNLTIHAEVKNIRRNGSGVGCSGFFGNLSTGRVVYINTEESNFMRQDLLYRYAKNMKDYGGFHSRNQFAGDFKDLVTNIVNLLEATSPHPFYTLKEDTPE